MTETLKEYYIVNSTGLDQIITLKLEGTCGEFDDVVGFSQIATDGLTTKILFPSDGVYEVYLDGVLDGVAKYYLTLFKSMIIYVGATICGNWGTQCTSFSSCSNVPVDYMTNAYSKLMYYYSAMKDRYDASMTLALGKIRCSAKEAWAEITLNETVRGISDTTELTRLELAHIYLEMYKNDAALETVGSQTDLKTLYNYTAINNCIGKLGILDCDVVVPVIGVPHSRTLTRVPSTFGLGTATDITLTYKFTANDDSFLAIIDTNIPNVTLAKLQDGYSHSQIVSATVGTSYYITYSYLNGVDTLQNTVAVTTTAYVPQWFGGESTEDDFAKTGGLATVADIKANITNISPKLQSTSNSSSSNSETLNKYIWWITEEPVRFFIGAFEILSGPWSASCDPNSYAIIKKTITTTMEDGVTQRVLNFYRTCPLMDLTGVTLEYTITEA